MHIYLKHSTFDLRSPFYPAVLANRTTPLWEPYTTPDPATHDFQEG